MPPDDPRPGCWPTLARFCWRYRSELAPAWLAIGLLAAGVAVRLVTFDRPAFWTLTVLNLASIAAAGGLWQWGGRVKLDRAVERAYAAVLTLAGGLWLALGAVLSPLRADLLLALLVGTVAGGVPWWWHRRRRAKVRLGRALQAWTAELAEAEPGSSLQRVEVDPEGGCTIRWRLRPGRTIEDIRPAITRLESLLDLRRGAIEVEQGERSARDILLRIQPRDPHASALTWPGPPRDATITEPVVIGRYADGGPCQAPLLGTHALIAGATGSGKSGVLNVVVGFLAACPDVVLWGCDLKFGLELGPWRPVFASGRVATTAEQAAELLEAAVRVIGARGEDLARQGLREWPTSPESPALVVVIDEHKALSGSKRAIAAVETITAQGRAMAVTVVDSTQYPTVPALGSSLIAPQCAVKVCLRVNTPGEANVVLGPGSASAGWKAHQIPKGKPGTLYLDAPGADSPRLARAWHVTDQMVASVARVDAARRPALDSFSERAAAGPPESTAHGTADDTAMARPVGTGDGTGDGTPWHSADSPPDSPPTPAAIARSSGSGESTAGAAARDPLEALLEALAEAGERGAKVPELAEATGMRGTWVYDRLGELVAAGKVVRGPHSRWFWRPEEGGLQAR